jgi:hypothetical protein
MIRAILNTIKDGAALAALILLVLGLTAWAEIATQLWS